LRPVARLQKTAKDRTGLVYVGSVRSFGVFEPVKTGLSLGPSLERPKDRTGPDLQTLRFSMHSIRVAGPVMAAVMDLGSLIPLEAGIIDPSVPQELPF
jgi:hypothetical protein